METTNLTRGQLAEATKTGIETIRFYEKKGLLEPPPRGSSGYRQYPADAVKRVSFIRHAKDLGFSLSEIKELLGLRIKGRSKCRDVKKQTDRKIEQIEQKIKDLQKIRRTLRKLSDACLDNDSPTTDCPILDCFETGRGQ